MVRINGRQMRWVGVLNLLLGVMAAFSAILSLLIVSLNATPQPTRLMTCALLLTAVSVCGIISGWKLGQGQGSLIVTFAFGLLLVIFAAADMIMERSFSVRLALLAIYGGINCVAVTMLNRISSESHQPTRS